MVTNKHVNDVLDYEKINWQGLLGPWYLTDAYLLAVAVANDGYLVSFYLRITPYLVPGARAKQIKMIQRGRS